MKKLMVCILIIIQAWNTSAQQASKSIASASKAPIRYSISAASANVGLIMTVDKETKWIENHNIISNQPFNNYVFLNGTKEISLSLVVAKDSLKYYRFNIIEDDNNWLFSDFAPATDKIYNEYQNKAVIGLGNFAIAGKKLTIEVYKITERNKITTSVIYNKPIRSAEVLLTGQVTTNKAGQEGVMLNDKKNGFEFKIHDKSTVNSILLAIKPSDLTFIYHVYLKNLSSGKTTYISNNWLYGYIDKYPHLLIDAGYFRDAGEYEVLVIPKLSSGFHSKEFPEKAERIRFVVLKSSSVFSLKEIILWGLLGLIIVSLIVTLVLYFTRQKNKRTLEAEKSQKQIAQMQLSAIRSQLNPHFMFNALSSIQNLMNSGQSDQANRYLSKFARLTRNILNNNDLNSLSDEIAFLEDYLQMEQLRFGFEYAIKLDSEFELSNIELPAMLLQPLVENGVKHGVSDLGKMGRVTIDITSNKNDINIVITDNGNGFDADEISSTGIGLTATRKRIELLNSLYKSSPILLDIRSERNQTVVTVTLSQWL